MPQVQQQNEVSKHGYLFGRKKEEMRLLRFLYDNKQNNYREN